MDSKKAAMASTAALLLSLNLLFSTIVTSQQEPPPPMATPPPPPPSTCPIDTISSSSCLSALNNTMGLIGSGALPTSIITDCCNLFSTLVGTLGSSQAGVCFCAAINVPGSNLIDAAAVLAGIFTVCPNNPVVGFHCSNN